MKASERLRALWDESADNPDASLRLANATLYLADVVEAAEPLVAEVVPDGRSYRMSDTRAKFPALASALTALNDALEAGDE